MSKEFNLLEAFKRIARERYDESFGWSVYTECFDDEDILEGYGEFKDEASLLEHMTVIAGIWEDKHQDAEQYRKEAGR